MTQNTSISCVLIFLEAYVGRGGNLNNSLMARCVRNICIKRLL